VILPGPRIPAVRTRTVTLVDGMVMGEGDQQAIMPAG
jgi:hypothetical protein